MTICLYCASPNFLTYFLAGKYSDGLVIAENAPKIRTSRLKHESILGRGHPFPTFHPHILSALLFLRLQRSTLPPKSRSWIRP